MRRAFSSLLQGNQLPTWRNASRSLYYRHYGGSSRSQVIEPKVNTLSLRGYLRSLLVETARTSCGCHTRIQMVERITTAS